MREIQLRTVDVNNIEEILALKVTPDQAHYVATPAKSLAYAYVQSDVTDPYGIYLGEQLVGYASIIFDVTDNMYNIWHFLIDSAYQGQGYGGQSLDKLLEIIQEKAIGLTDQVALGVEVENVIANKLYLSRGFVDSGERDEDGEIVLIRQLTN